MNNNKRKEVFIDLIVMIRVMSHSAKQGTERSFAIGQGEIRSNLRRFLLVILSKDYRIKLQIHHWWATLNPNVRAWAVKYSRETCHRHTLYIYIRGFRMDKIWSNEGYAIRRWIKPSKMRGSRNRYDIIGEITVVNWINATVSMQIVHLL